MQEFEIKLTNDDLQWMPEKAHETDAGFDLKARAICSVGEGGVIGNEKELSNNVHYLFSGNRCLVKTGVFLGLKPGWEAQIRPRSGMALKYGISVTNSPGTIDADYRNEIGVILHNLNNETYAIKSGLKIAQMVIKEVPQIGFKQVLNLDETERGIGGFGSTGQ